MQFLPQKYSPLVSDEVMKTIPNVCKISGQMELDIRYGAQIQTENFCFWQESFSIASSMFPFQGKIFFADRECNYQREAELMQLQGDFQAIVELNGGHLLRYGHEVDRYPDLPECTPAMREDGKKYHVYGDDIANGNPNLHVDEPFVPHVLRIGNKENIMPQKDGFSHIDGITSQDYFPFQYTPDVSDAVLRTIPNVCRIPYEFIPVAGGERFLYFSEGNSCYTTAQLQIDTPLIEWQMMGGKYIEFFERHSCQNGSKHAKYLEQDEVKMELLLETNGRQILRYEHVPQEYADFPECTQEIFDAGAQFRVNTKDAPYVLTFLTQIDMPFVAHALSEGKDVAPIPYQRETTFSIQEIWEKTQMPLSLREAANIGIGIILFLFLILVWQHFKKPKHLRKK